MYLSGNDVERGELEMSALENSRTHLVRSAERREAAMYSDERFLSGAAQSPSREVRALTDSLRRRTSPLVQNKIYRSISQVGLLPPKLC